MATFERYFIDDKETHIENKIPYYKSLCIDDLIKKCGREKYNEIVEKYELEV